MPAQPLAKAASRVVQPAVLKVLSAKSRYEFSVALSRIATTSDNPVTDVPATVTTSGQAVVRGARMLTRSAAAALQTAAVMETQSLGGFRFEGHKRCAVFSELRKTSLYSACTAAIAAMTSAPTTVASARRLDYKTLPDIVESDRRDSIDCWKDLTRPLTISYAASFAVLILHS